MISPSHHHSSDSRLLVKSSPMSDHAESPSERLAQSNYFVRVFNQVPNERKSQTCTNLEYGIFFPMKEDLISQYPGYISYLLQFF